jgi:hypothetical protein
MANQVVSRMMRPMPYFLSSVLLAAAAAPVFSAPVTVIGSLTGRHSDNVGKQDLEESGSETIARLNLSHASDPGQCESDLDASLSYEYWLDDYYDPESSATSGFSGRCQLRQGLDWTLDNNLSQVLRSSRQNDTPENRSRKNIFRTGPVLTVPLSEVDQLQASVSFENTEYEDRELRDSKRYIASLGWNHRFDPTLSGGISASGNQQELDTGAETDSSSVNLNFNKTWATSSLSGSLGYSRQKTRLGSTEFTSDGLVGSLTLTREINPTASAYFSVSRQLTDQASDFTLEYGDVEFDYTEQFGIEVTAIELGLNKSFSDGSRLDIQGFANRQDYQVGDQQENALGMRFSASRPIRPHLSFTANGSYEYLRYEDNLQDDQLVKASVGLSYELTADFDCSASLGHSMRESDLPTVEYNENWIQVALSYRFL